MANRQKKRAKKPPRQPIFKPLIDIVVPFFGEIELAKKTIACVPDACGDVPYNLILVDNGTPNQKGRELFNDLKADGLDFREIWLKINMGYPGGVNAGVHAGSAPLIFVLTADVVMEPGAIEAAVKEMDDPSIGVIGCKLLFPDGATRGEPGKVQHAGLATNLAADVFHIFIGWSADHPKVNTRREMNAVTGAAFMTRRNLFMQVGGLNTMYGRGTFEDVEYCAKMKMLEKKVIYLPTAAGTHYVGGSIDEGANEGGFPLQQNQSLFMAQMAGAVEWDEWRYW
jgi:GT2 family glycosyltransferase